MAVWLIRAGSHGEYELKFIQERRVYVTWDALDVNLDKLANRGELTRAMTQPHTRKVVPFSLTAIYVLP